MDTILCDASTADDAVTGDVGNGSDGPIQGVATAFPDVTAAAASVLESGGNAADAAAAAAWSLSVCEPSGSGLGGHTTVLVRTAEGAVMVLEGVSRAPMVASRKTISRAEQHKGRKAATVPSTPAVLAELSTEFGRLGVAAALEPAIALATEGFEWTALQRREARWCWNDLAAAGADRLFARSNGRVLKPGDRLRQPLLAKTLKRLARCGVDDFYRGGIARKIVQDMADHGGLMGPEDLVEASRANLRAPVSTAYRGLRLVSTPPPAGGVTLLQGLKLADALAERYGTGSPSADLAAVLDAVYGAFAFRERWPLASDEFTPSVRDWMLGDQLIDELTEDLAVRRIRASIEAGAEPPGETTHLCVADAAGNVVALTQSIQSLYGAKVAHPTLGFFYNNYLTTCLRGGHPNALAPGCVPRSNICPMIALDADNRPRLAIGAAGSRRITSSVLQVTRRVLNQGASIRDAVEAPRGHALLNGKVWIEQPALTGETKAVVEKHYSKVVRKKKHDYKLGCVQALAWDADGIVSAAADPRRDGSTWTGRAGDPEGSL
ncbi:MAG: gamma-glutamyltransferase family protein [Alphaproteobacteria bacterium]|nr:gamma-glutamyltransferase family protein [Alphaproteobacteria bacterium]